MFNRKKSTIRRKHFLIDSNQQRKRQSKKTRNRALNLLSKARFLKKLLGFLKASFLFTFTLFAMAGFIAFATFSPYFEIKKINIIRDNPNLNVEAVQEILQPFRGRNLIFLDIKKLKVSLLENFLEFRSIEITEKWPDTINIAIKLSPPAFTIFDIESANFAVISNDGVILSLQPDNSLPVLKIKNIKKPFSPGDLFVEKEWLDKIQEANGLLLNQIKLTTKDIVLLPIAREAHFITNDETAIWFDLRTDIPDQVRKLELGANKIGLYSKKLEHIDLRIPGQLFWK